MTKNLNPTQLATRAERNTSRISLIEIFIGNVTLNTLARITYAVNTKMSRVYEAVGAKHVVPGPTPPATHNTCSARMSANPRDGVTNAWGQTHDIKNLFISDGSAMTTAGAANPTLTIVTLALRQAEYISQRMKARKV